MRNKRARYIDDPDGIEYEILGYVTSGSVIFAVLEDTTSDSREMVIEESEDDADIKNFNVPFRGKITTEHIRELFII